MRDLYRGPDKAYASMDFTGVGIITEDIFLQSFIVKKLHQYSEVEMRDFFFITDMFGSSNGNSGMNFDSFKKTFFPHLYLIQEGDESEDEKKDRETKK